MMTHLTPLFALLMLLSILLLTGCDSNRHTGEDGRLVFEYYSAEDAHNFNKPIIEGGYLDVFVTDIPEGRPVEIQSVTPLTPRLASVEGYSENLFIIKGLSEGWASFEVHGIDADEQVRIDTLRMRIDRAHAVHFRPEGARILDGTGGFDGHHLEVTINSRVEIPWTRRSAKEEPLVGYGVYPVTMDPPDAAELHDRLTTHDTITLFMPEEPVIFELRPAEGLEGDTLIIEVVDPSLTDTLAITTSGIRSAALHRLFLPSTEPHPIFGGHHQLRRTTLSQVLEYHLIERGLPIKDMLPWILTWLWLGLLSLIMARCCWRNRPQ